MGYGLEVELVRHAHMLDLLTTPYVFDEEQARQMAAAGADIVVCHLGLTTGGTIGAGTARTPGRLRGRDQCAGRRRPPPPSPT
jgi:predicted TIM-barrel enzyme